MKTIEDVKLKDTMPESISSDKKVNAMNEVLDPRLQYLGSMVDLPSLYTNIDKLPSLALDHLAYQYDVTVWRDSWGIEVKRSVLKTALSDKRKKGTKAAVKQAVESIGVAASIVNWYETEPKGTPYTFKIYVALSQVAGTVTEEQQEDLIRLIDDAKSLRDSYDLILQTVLNGGVGTYGCMRVLTVSSI